MTARKGVLFSGVCAFLVGAVSQPVLRHFGIGLELVAWGVSFAALILSLHLLFPPYGRILADISPPLGDLKPLGVYDAVDGMGDRGRITALRWGGWAFGLIGGICVISSGTATSAGGTALQLMVGVPLLAICVNARIARERSLSRVRSGEEVRPGEGLR